ncbi:MAG: hypothetical protein JST68_28405 [Bacteroidetes bacterium]|nr:hypothetical protein [Bacteroidota bacterium]
MKRQLVLFSVLTMKFLAAKSQGESALGVRAGGSLGVTYKYYQSRGFAFEGLVDYDLDKSVKGIRAALLFEKLAPLVGNKFAAQIGVGPVYSFPNDGHFGAAGTLGFDWRVSAVTLQLDWQPTWYFTNGDHFGGSNVGVSARYILNRKRRHQREERERNLPPNQPPAQQSPVQQQPA